jgi:hypothetical protein
MYKATQAITARFSHYRGRTQRETGDVVITRGYPCFLHGRSPKLPRKI